MFQDVDGAVSSQALALFAPASRAPVYCFHDTFLRTELSAGSMVKFEEIDLLASS